MKASEIRHVFKGADAALKAGRMTKEEHDRILTHYYGTIDLQEAIDRHAHAKHETFIAITIAVLFILSVGFLFLDDGITGLTILDGAAQPLTDVTSVMVSGTMYGDGNATFWLDTPNGSLLIGTIASDTGMPMTDKASYTQGEPITVLHAPENETYYFDDGTTSTPIEMPLNATSGGTLLIVTSEATYRLPIIIGEAERTTMFTGLCMETCGIGRTNGTIRIETSGTSVEMTSIEAGTANRPPAITTPFDAISTNETVMINLSTHFSDPDGDALLFSTSMSTIAALSVEGDVLTITPIADGNETIAIYASDLTELISAGFGLAIINNPAITTPNGTTALNETTAPSPEINETLNTTGLNLTLNSTNTTNTTPVIGCAEPDPNKRPLECIQDGNSTYFRPEDIFLESKDALAVGRLTPVGNLLIKGGIIEHSASEPGSRDWSRGYQDDDGDFVPTIWIDSRSGDLHLTGTLTEANANIVFEPGLTALMNDREIILALIDTRTGDLTVRGNVIPYRRSFE